MSSGEETISDSSHLSARMLIYSLLSDQRVGPVIVLDKKSGFEFETEGHSTVYGPRDDNHLTAKH